MEPATAHAACLRRAASSLRSSTCLRARLRCSCSPRAPGSGPRRHRAPRDGSTQATDAVMRSFGASPPVHAAVELERLVRERVRATAVGYIPGRERAAPPPARPRLLRVREPGRLRLLRPRPRLPRRDRARPSGSAAGSGWCRRSRPPPCACARRGSSRPSPRSCDADGGVVTRDRPLERRPRRATPRDARRLAAVAARGRALRSAVRSIVTVSTPHHGTPVAHLFNSLFGQQLLRLLSLLTIYVLRAGRLPSARAPRRPPPPSREGSSGHPRPAAPPRAPRRLLAQPPRRDRAFFASLGKDQDLVGQITPGSMDVFNAATRDRPGVRYGCVVTRARPPGIRSAIGAGISTVRAGDARGLRRALPGRVPHACRSAQPRLTRAQAARSARAYGWRTDARANDGMVPTL